MNCKFYNILDSGYQNPYGANNYGNQYPQQYGTNLGYMNQSQQQYPNNYGNVQPGQYNPYQNNGQYGGGYGGSNQFQK
jgi:hypothetical protein